MVHPVYQSEVQGKIIWVGPKESHISSGKGLSPKAEDKPGQFAVVTLGKG